MAFGWLKKAARAAGKGIKKGVKGVGKGIKATAKAGRTISKAVRKVPVVGKGIGGVFDLTVNAPFQVAGQIAKGERLDRVGMNALKSQMRSVKDVAPYAQTVISVVPGIGPAVSAGLGTGLALASGQPITKALAEGVKGALPGGPLAKQAFSVGQAVAEGKPVDKIVLAALPLDDQAKRAAGMALNVTARVARGENVGKALLKQADDALLLIPKEAREGLGVGIALGQAKKLQGIALQHVKGSALDSLGKGGLNLIKASPMLASAGKILSPAAKAGYSVGVGVMAIKKPQPFHMAAIRHKMSPEQRAGFDMAIAARVGMSKKPAPRNLSPAQQLGYYTARGTLKTNTLPVVMKAIQSNPEINAGLKVATVEKPSLLVRLKRWLSDITR